MARVVHPHHLNLLLLMGLGVAGGALGGRFFQRIRIPQVIGYIAIGILIGQSGLRLITDDLIQTLRPFNFFALGIIGFLIGGELRAATFRKYGKQFFGILFGEGLGSFVLVGAAACLIVQAVTHDVRASVAAGVVLGAISSATDPATTVQVFWEYRTLGLLTTAVTAVVALDDALSLTLYGLGTNVAQIVTGGSPSIWPEIWRVSVELFGALILGGAAALGLSRLLRWLDDPEKTLALLVGSVLIVIGIAAMLDMDIILAAMMLGVTLTNVAPHRSEKAFSTVRQFASPIYVLFFVLVGARLSIGAMQPWVWWLVAAYVLFRTIGKWLGAYVAAARTGAAEPVRKYTGMCLFAQGGVAVGLSIMASQHLSGETAPVGGMPLGDLVITVVTATTFIVQLLGPPFVKLASRLAGEIGLNVTEEDLMATYSVADVMQQPVTLKEGTALGEILRVFADNDYLSYPVVDEKGRVIGIVSIEQLKETFGEQSLDRWLVASDLMTPARAVATADMNLAEAVKLMRRVGVDSLPVVKDAQERVLVGFLHTRAVDQLLKEQIIGKRAAAEAAA